MSERDETLRRAEHLVRQGRLDAAVAEYARLVEQSPHDLAAANLLGDLYVRLAQSDRALPLFLRIADSYFHEGFFSKAAGFYKKILKFQPQDETTLMRLGVVSLRQGLAVEARGYLMALLSRRRQRRDDAGVDEVVVLLAQASPEDLDARLEAARAALRLQGRAAVPMACDTADVLEARGRAGVAVALLETALGAAPNDVGVRARLVRKAIDEDELERAREWLSAETAVADPTLAALRDEIDVIEAMRRTEPDDPAARAAAPPASPGTDSARAVAAGLSGPGPGEPAPPADAPQPPPAPAPPAGESLDLTDALNALTLSSGTAAAAPQPIVAGPGQGTAEPAVTAAFGQDEVPAEGEGEEFEQAFEDARREIAESARHEGPQLLEVAATYEAAGLTDEAVETLAHAARDPRTRSQASRRMAAIWRARGEHAQAVEWLERAVTGDEDTPARDPMLRELARALEACGEGVRALAVWLEVQAVRPGDEEARAAVERLCREPFGGGGSSTP